MAFRFLHHLERGKSRMFLCLNQATFWSIHLLAWFCYSLVIYGMYEEETGILRMMPLVLAFVSFAPCLAAVHWRVGVRQGYNDCADNVSDDDDDDVSCCEMPRRNLFVAWQMSTIVTRLTSLGLLCFVFSQHWVEVGGTLKVALLMMIPYLLLIVAMNFGLQFGTFGHASLRSALLSIALPNDFCPSRTSFKSPSSPVAKTGKYIILNVSSNFVIHLILWLTMTFYCWECTEVLDSRFRKLSICFPLAVGLWLANLILTLVTWRLCIRHGLDGSDETAVKKVDHGHEAATSLPPPSSSAAWTGKTNLVTTKF